MPLTEVMLKIIYNENTKEVDLSDQGLFDNVIDEIVSLLNKIPRVQSLVLYRNNLGNESASKLAKLKHILSLNLSANNFSDDSILPLLENQKFTRINLSRNNISKHGIDIILERKGNRDINTSENLQDREEIKLKSFSILNRDSPILSPESNLKKKQKLDSQDIIETIKNLDTDTKQKIIEEIIRNASPGDQKKYIQTAINSARIEIVEEIIKEKSIEFSPKA